MQISAGKAVMCSQSVEYTRYTPLSSEWNIQLHIHSQSGAGWIYLWTHLRANGTPAGESYLSWANLGTDQYFTVRNCIITIIHSMESWTGSHFEAGQGLEFSMLISWYSTSTHAHWWMTFRRNHISKIQPLAKRMFCSDSVPMLITGCF